MSDITNVSGVLDNIALVIPDSNSGYTPTFSNGLDLENQTPLIFHYEGLNQIEIASDITDHYAEDNTTLQDHASLRPEKISVHGFVGEVVIDDNSSTVAKAAETVSRLPLISGISPSLSVTALNAYNSAASAIFEAKRNHHAQRQHRRDYAACRAAKMCALKDLLHKHYPCNDGVPRPACGNRL